MLTLSQLSVLFYLVFITWPRKVVSLSAAEKKFQTFGNGAAVICGMLLLSPMTSKPHFCMLFIPVCYCLTDYVYRQKSKFVAAMLLLVFLCGTLATKDLMGRSLSNHFLGYGSLTLCALACLLGTGYVLQARRKSNSQSQTMRLALQIDIVNDEEKSRKQEAVINQPATNNTNDRTLQFK